MVNYDHCRGCGLRPDSLDKELGYCLPCQEKRDQFAVAAFPAIIGNGSKLLLENPADAAKVAYHFADAAMEARK